MYFNAIGAAAELARRASAALRVRTACGGAAVGTAPELGVLATAALLKSMKRVHHSKVCPIPNYWDEYMHD